MVHISHNPFNLQAQIRAGKKLPSRSVLQTERIRYKDPDYSDSEIDGLMRYFRIESYSKLPSLLKGMRFRTA